MATTNPFDLLGDDDSDDPSLLLAAQHQKVTAAKKTAPAAAQAAKSAKLPTKPLPPSQAVREARNEGERGGGCGGGRGYGRGRGGPGGYSQDLDNSETTFGNGNGIPHKPSEDRESGKTSERRGYSRGGYRGGRRGGFSNAEGEAVEGERHRRTYERRSGTGRGNDFKRDGSGRGNWGTPGEEIVQEIEEPAGVNEANVAAAAEKVVNEEDNVDGNKEQHANEAEEKEPEDNEMTLEEYEKILEEKRKALLALKVEERKVDGKEFESMQMISKKKDEEEVFIKLGSDKDKRKEAADKEERAKKSVSINEFLKPADGESPYYRQGGRGRGRGRGQRGGYGGGGRAYDAPAPSIMDPGHFPSLK